MHHYSLLYAAATMLTTCICRLQLLQRYSLSLADPEEELPYHYLLFATPSRKFSILLQNRLQSSDDVNISHRKRPCQYQQPDGSPLSFGHWILVNQWKLRCDILKYYLNFRKIHSDFLLYWNQKWILFITLKYIFFPLNVEFILMRVYSKC